MNNVPKLRFKEFESDWKLKKLGDVLIIKSGKDQKKIQNEKGIYPIYGTGGIIGYGNYFLTDKPCVCIGRKGTINKPIYLDIPFWSVDTLFYSECKYNNNPKFQYNLFETIYWYKFNEASGVPSLSRKTIESIQKYIPAEKEQNKIASFLSTVDKKINILNQKLKFLKLYNKGVLEKMFEQKLSYKILNDVTEKIGDGLHGTPQYVDNSEIKFINGNNLQESKKISLSNCKNVSKADYNNQKINLSDRTLFLSINGTIGKTSFYEGEKILLGKSVCYINFYKKEDMLLFNCFLGTEKAKKYIFSSVTGSTIKNLSLNDIKNFKFPILGPKQVETIINIIQRLDTKIEKKLNKLENLKLFTVHHL